MLHWVSSPEIKIKHKIKLNSKFQLFILSVNELSGFDNLSQMSLRNVHSASHLLLMLINI